MAIIDFGKGKKPPSLCRILRAFGQRPKSEAVEVIAQWKSLCHPQTSVCGIDSELN
ncbi:hypothetical protein [Rhizobium ruizarguesonis]|uniref:hypothetical protein n=1 Tax=Rhizobium ruizarguesonis TaxID=2081791 RepID=UPI0037120DB1